MHGRSGGLLAGTGLFLTAALAGCGGGQRILFHSAASTDAPHRAVLALLLAVTARERGHQADLALSGEGVLLLKRAEEVQAPGQPGARELLERAVRWSLPIHV